MKKILLEKGLAFFIVFIAFLIAGVLYSQGKISFLPKDKKVELQNVVAELPYAGKEFRLSYVGNEDNYLKISSFEEAEGWSGDANFDFTDPIERESSLILGSQNRYKSTATLTLKNAFNLDDYQNLRFFVNLRTDPQNLEETNLNLIGPNGTTYTYPLRGLNQGSNFLTMETDRFSLSTEGAKTETESTERQVTQIRLELVSRPKAAASVSFDNLWAEKNNYYLKDWNTRSNEAMGWVGTKSGFGIMINNSLATVKEIASAKDYTAITRITPFRNGSFGIFNRGDYKSGVGYYFILGGADTSSWQVHKYGKFKSGNLESEVLTKGEITNFKLEKAKPYWLKAELMGNRLIYSLSLDGLTYSTVAEVNDNSFGSGGIGVISNTLVMVDNFGFEQ